MINNCQTQRTAESQRKRVITIAAVQSTPMIKIGATTWSWWPQTRVINRDSITLGDSGASEGARQAYKSAPTLLVW
jgi:hypothetical protein